MKNIYLKQDEEIISVVDKLVESKDSRINLFIPSGAQIWQSSINLKLLKREADNLEKEVSLIVSDDLGAEMAEKIGFIVKKETDFPVETIKEENSEDQEVIQENEIEFQETPQSMPDSSAEAAVPEKDTMDKTELESESGNKQTDNYCTATGREPVAGKPEGQG